MAFTIFVALTILRQLVTSVVATLICARKNSPFTWEQVLKVLYQPAVGGNRVADELKKKFRRQCKQFFHYDSFDIVYSISLRMVFTTCFYVCFLPIYIYYFFVYNTRFLQCKDIMQIYFLLLQYSIMQDHLLVQVVVHNDVAEV